MKILTAWVVTEADTYELVAATDDQYDSSHFDERLDDAAVNYGNEPRLLEIDVDEQLVRDLFADHGTGRAGL